MFGKTQAASLTVHSVENKFSTRTVRVAVAVMAARDRLKIFYVPNVMRQLFWIHRLLQVKPGCHPSLSQKLIDPND